MKDPNPLRRPITVPMTTAPAKRPRIRVGRRSASGSKAPRSQSQVAEPDSLESKDPLGLPPLGMTWRILVTRTISGGRLRLPVPLPADVANETVDDDQQLAAIFDRIAPPDAVTMCKTPMNKSAMSRKSQKVLRGPSLGDAKDDTAD